MAGHFGLVSLAVYSDMSVVDTLHCMSHPYHRHRLGVLVAETNSHSWLCFYLETCLLHVPNINLFLLQCIRIAKLIFDTWNVYLYSILIGIHSHENKVWF